jgi:hypothetical protein
MKTPVVVVPLPTSVNDIFMHALFARVTLSNNDVIEFETRYNKDTNTVELIVPSSAFKYFDQLTGMKRGPKLERFIDWLIGSKRFEPIAQPNFISASAFDIHLGATTAKLDDRNVVIFPGSRPSMIGYNLKAKNLSDPLQPDQTNPCCPVVDPDDPTQCVKFYLVWQYICGSNTFLELRITANITSPSVAPETIINDIVISTDGVSPGDVIESEVLSLDSVPSGALISLTIQRNFTGSSDPNTEMIGMIGVRLE